ncbi:MAG: RNA methyltransferase [Bacteroidales bacterium]
MKKSFKKLSLHELGRISVDDFKLAAKIPVAIILDNVRSGQNVGSAFRTSDGFAVEKMYLCGITCKPPHKEIQKTALGAHEAVDWEYSDSTEAVIEQLQKDGYIICSVEQTRNSTFLHNLTIDTEKKYALVFGNEVSGVQQSVIDMSDKCIEIPQFGTKHSFNISVSCGMVLWSVAQKFLV